jgi:hypothetical protein
MAMTRSRPERYSMAAHSFRSRAGSATPKYDYVSIIHFTICHYTCARYHRTSSLCAVFHSRNRKFARKQEKWYLHVISQDLKVQQQL